MRERKRRKSSSINAYKRISLQIKDELKRLSKYSKTKVLPVYGGESIERQIKDIKSGVDIVVGTPGRVLDHINRRTLKLGGIDFLVLDEADEMLNMGFIEDIETIMQVLLKKNKLCFFQLQCQHLLKISFKLHEKDVEHIAILKNL